MRKLSFIEGTQVTLGRTADLQCAWLLLLYLPTPVLAHCSFPPFHYALAHKFFQKASPGSSGVLCGLHITVLPSVMALVSVMDIYINASYRHLWVVDICLHDVCLTLRIWTLQSKGYALFILVFPGLENKYLWKKGSERRKGKGRERGMTYIKIHWTDS